MRNVRGREDEDVRLYLHKRYSVLTEEEELNTIKEDTPVGVGFHHVETNALSSLEKNIFEHFLTYQGNQMNTN